MFHRNTVTKGRGDYRPSGAERALVGREYGSGHRASKAKKRLVSSPPPYYNPPNSRIYVRGVIDVQIQNSRRAFAARRPAMRIASDVSVVILGAGFGGLCMAIKLREAGLEDFLILEKSSRAGGTWRDNTYPGCACDIPSHLYSYSFAQDAGWTRRYAPQSEILAYIHAVIRKHGLEDRILHDTTVSSLVWDDDTRLWTITTADGRTILARALVSAVGGLHDPAYPDIPGLDEFKGEAFHTSRWRHDIDLTGKRVAVIGSGASAIQVIPEIAPRVASLQVYQRTPPWILPRNDRGYSTVERLAFRHVPGLLRATRALHYWNAEMMALGFVVRPGWMRAVEKRALRFLERSVPDAALRKKLVPTYRMGWKRVLLSNTYYPTLSQPHVELVTDRIARLTSDAIVSRNGARRPVDVVVYATGFRPFYQSLDIEIRGREGRRLADEWKDGPQAYRGVSVSGFPNYFLLMGPNSAVGHNSIIFMIECQARYIIQCLSWLESGKLDAVDVRPEVQADYNRAIREGFDGTVWQDKDEPRSSGSWYVHPSGRHTVIWPGFSTSYWFSTRRANPTDYVPHHVASPALPAETPLRRAA